MIKKMNFAKNGFTLVEMLIALAISAIIISAAFGSYTIIARNFEWQADMKYMSQTAKSVVEMMTKDIRNAGFRFESSAAITDPIKIYDAGDAKDRIEIIYDETESPYKRVKIEYRLQQYSNDNSRFRLFKKKTNMTNNTVEYDSPIADYIEVLQFEATRQDCPTDGSIVAGCGTKAWFKPDECASPADDYDNFPTRIAGHTSNRNLRCGCSNKSFDGDMNTVFSCKVKDSPMNDWGITAFSFSNPVILEKVKLSTSAHLGCYMLFGSCRINYAGPGLNEYYGTAPRSWKYDFAIYALNYDDNQWSDYNGYRGGTMQTSGELPGVKEFNFQTPTSINWVTLRMSKPKGYNWVSGNIIGIDGGHLPIQLPEIEFYGEKFEMSGIPIPTETSISIILRSPNEHGNDNRAFTESVGDYSFSANDKYLRDTYVTSATVRNIYYQSQ